ncbi:MAG: DUF7008 domain-containing protein [Planctomycetota bacterium]|jgi:hypothetical protein
MIDRQALLSDLQALLRALEADLLERSDSAEVPEVGQTLRAEFQKAKKAERTAQNYEDWRSDYITQAAAAWVLSCVFARFLEDNRLVDPPRLAGPGDRLGRARAFEIVLARKQAGGEVQTTWFERHGSTPITELPADWPDDYRQIVERRMEVIETNPEIALIEQPEYKRRWNTEPWESQVERALKDWLVDRLESYFDSDGRMNNDGKPTSPEWITALFASPIFDEQKKLGGRILPANEVFSLLLAAVDSRGGKMTSAALARAVNYPPIRLRGLLAVTQRVLNIDGYAVLTRDEASDTVELNRDLLCRQFDLV